MPKIKVTFSDGSTMTFHEDQTFMTVSFSVDAENPKKSYPSQSEIFGLWNHIHDGLVPSLLEIIANSKFFFDVEKPEVYYNSQSVVKIESL